ERALPADRPRAALRRPAPWRAGLPVWQAASGTLGPRDRFRRPSAPQAPCPGTHRSFTDRVRSLGSPSRPQPPPNPRRRVSYVQRLTYGNQEKNPEGGGLAALRPPPPAP